jgi:membrane-bound ClpP family serine protease
MHLHQSNGKAVTHPVPLRALLSLPWHRTKVTNIAVNRKGEAMTGLTGTHDLLAKEDSLEAQGTDVTRAAASPWRSTFLRWVVQDSPYIAMLLLALGGVAFHLSASYWVVLTPAFGIICVVAGWRHFETREGRLQLAFTQALSWLAFIFTICVLFNNVVQGTLNTSATSLAMMSLLALGTFVAGLQSRVCR